MQNGKQSIKCDVKSCKYNMEAACDLTEIQVAPKCGCNSEKKDESLCASYECKMKKH